MELLEYLHSRNYGDINNFSQRAFDQVLDAEEVEEEEETEADWEEEEKLEMEMDDDPWKGDEDFEDL